MYSSKLKKVQLTLTDVKRAVLTEVVFVTETVADVVVYVDENGAPYLTSTVERVSSIPSTSAEPTAVPTSAPVQPSPPPAPVSPSPSSSAEPELVAAQNVAPTPSSAAPPPPAPEPTSSSSPLPPPPPAPSSEAPVPSSEPAAPPPAPSPSVQALQAPEPKPSVSSTDSFPLGITYDPYKGSADKTDCKTADEIAADFGKMKDFGIVRIYGNDCGQIPVAVRSAKLNGQKLMGGIYAPLQVRNPSRWMRSASLVDHC